MPRTVIVLFALLVVALGLPMTSSAQILINEVFYAGATAADDWIELKNVGGTTVDVSSYWLCARFQYRQLSAMTLLDGAGLSIGPDDIITLQSWINLNGVSSDVGLYTSTSFASAGAMVDFVQYGTSADVGRSDVAWAANIWTRSSPTVYDFVATAGVGQSVAYGGVNSGAGGETLSGDWFNDIPTRGQENLPVPVSVTTWGQIKSFYQ